MERMEEKEKKKIIHYVKSDTFCMTELVEKTENWVIWHISWTLLYNEKLIAELSSPYDMCVPSRMKMLWSRGACTKTVLESRNQEQFLVSKFIRCGNLRSIWLRDVGESVLKLMLHSLRCFRFPKWISEFEGTLMREIDSACNSNSSNSTMFLKRELDAKQRRGVQNVNGFEDFLVFGLIIWYKTMPREGMGRIDERGKGKWFPWLKCE